MEAYSDFSEGRACRGKGFPDVFVCDMAVQPPRFSISGLPSWVRQG